MSVIITVRQGALPAAFLARAKAEGMDIKDFPGLDYIFEVFNREVEDFTAEMYPEVASAEPGDKVLRSSLAQELDFEAGWAGANWALARHIRRDPPWAVPGLRLPISSDFDCTRTGDGVDIYVIDTGIEVAHPELGGRATMVWEFTSTGGVGDDNGHGTACSGCAAGSTVGFARDALLWGCKVLGSDNTGSLSNIISGIGQAVSHYNGRSETNRPAVMSISIGGENSGSYGSALGSAMSAGMVVVASAGNDASNLDSNDFSAFPAETINVLAAGAIMPGDAPASFTNYGTRVDLLAAGYAVWTSTLRSTGNDYRLWNGTSFSCPTIAGAIACVLEDYQRLTSTAQTQQVRNYMKEQATWDRYIPSGRHEPMTPAILYLEPTDDYPVVPGLTPKV